MDYIKVAHVDDFRKKWIRSYRLLGRYVGIVKEADGSFYATEIMCKHNNVDLTTGKFKGDCVTCPRHGWVYNIKTGECITHRSTPLRRHGLKIEGGDIFVTIRPLEEAVQDDWEEIPTIRFREPNK